MYRTRELFREKDRFIGTFLYIFVKKQYLKMPEKEQNDHQEKQMTVDCLNGHFFETWPGRQKMAI